MFKCYTAPTNQTIKLKKFANHPIAVGADPKSNGQIMAELTDKFSGLPGYDDRDH